MSTIQEYVHVIGFLQGLLLFALLMFDSRLHSSSRILGVLCLIMASEFFKPFILQNEALYFLIGWVFYLPAACGSLAYLFCRSAILDTPLRMKDGLYFLPLFICYALAFDIFMFKPNEFASWALGTPPTLWRLQASEVVIFAQAFGFACITIVMIWRYRQSAQNTLSQFNPLIFKWLLLLQVFTLFIWTLNALSSLIDANIVYAQIANLLMVLLIYIIAVAQWRVPDLFAIPQLAEEQSKSQSNTSGELTSDLRQTLFQDIKSMTESRKLYLDNGLTLSSLADASGLSRQQVSEVLNRYANKNFFEFINDYRVAVVKQKLIEETSRSVLDIAMECGLVRIFVKEFF